MKKLQQIILLITCILIMMVGAIQKDGKILGHSLQSRTTEENADTHKRADTRTLQDGTIVINTITLGKDIQGYGGPVPLELFVKDNVVTGIKALPNSETPDFFNRAKSLLSKWDDKTVDQALTMKVDGVSGATFSSRAIIQNVRAGLQYAVKKAQQPSLWEKMGMTWKYALGLIVVLMAAIVPLFYKNRHYRLLQLSLNVVVLGLLCGTFLDWTLFIGYMANGTNIWISLIPIIMLITAFIYPFFGKRQYYCTNICPFGSLQELASKTNHKKWRMSQTLAKRLTRFRELLFAGLMVMMLTGLWMEWMDYELFAAFIWQSAPALVIVLAILFVLLSVFVPRPYCRFVCPTGTLFKIKD